MTAEVRTGASYSWGFAIPFGLSIVAISVAIGAGSQTVTAIFTSIVGAFALSGGLLEVLLDDVGRSASAKRSKAMARFMALPATLGAIGLLVLRAKQPEGVALALGLIAMCGPVLVVLALTRRLRVLGLMGGAGLLGGAVAGLVYFI